MIGDTFQQILFTKPGTAVHDTCVTSTLPEGPGDVLIETEYSVVSAGTELAILTGKEGWAPLPFTPGYGSVGRVVRIGSGVTDVQVGERIFTYGKHARYGLTDVLRLPVGEDADPIKATFARIAAVSITALRTADIALGDTVAVIGLGLVGNFAAQLFALSGCEVIGIDLSEKRREQARLCGIAHTLTPGENLVAEIEELTDGRKCRTVVEATGLPEVAVSAAELAGKQGEVILLGSPRKECMRDLTPVLNRIHIWDNGCVTYKGAHEWRYPVKEDSAGYGRFSMEGNVRSLLSLIAQGKLKVEPLLTHVVSPADCQSVYRGLRDQRDVYTGVVFDWSK